MSFVATYTREQWERAGGWNDVEEAVDVVVLLWEIGGLPDEDVLPVVITGDPHTGQRWPVDAEEPPPVPFQLYRRDEEHGGWDLQETGDAWLHAHDVIYVPNPAATRRPARP